MVELVSTELGSANQKRIFTIDASLNVAVCLGTSGLLDLNGQDANHGVALALADDCRSQVHEPATFGPHREALGNPGCECFPELLVT